LTIGWINWNERLTKNPPNSGRTPVLRVLSLAGYFAMVGGLAALVWLRAIFSTCAPVILLQAAALALFLWARITFGRRSYHLGADPTAGGLVTTGPYRHIRHPIYAAFCLFTEAGVMAHWSLKTGLLGGLILASALVRIFCEESLVSARYPEYAEYRTRTWRMVPYLF